MTVSIRPSPGTPRDYHFPRFSRHVLPNKLRVIIAPVRKLPVVSVLAVIDAGASMDMKGAEGLAQLTAEMLREGTEKHTGIEILDGFERIGASLEAGADWDSTIVSVTLLEDHLAEGLSLFAEVLTMPSFPEHELERLKAERVAERLQILAEPRALADESFAKVLYPSGNRYAEPIGGRRAAISAITRRQVVEFFSSAYKPDATSLIVVGDVTTEDALKHVEDVLGNWEGIRVARIQSSAKENDELRTVEVVSKADAAQSELRLGHVGVARTHPDYFSIVVMNALLGGLFSSRINLNLRERHGYTYGASSYFDWRREPGPFVIATAVQSEVSAQAVREILNEVDNMRNDEVPPDELSLATSYLEGVFPIRYETTSAIASALANMVIFGLPEDFYDTYRDKVRAVTQADVLRAAQNCVHPGKLQCVVVGNPDLVTVPLTELNIGPVSVQPAAEA